MRHYSGRGNRWVEGQWRFRKEENEGQGNNGMMSGFGMSEKKTYRIIYHTFFLPNAGVFHGNNMGFLNRLHKKNAEGSDSASSLFAEANHNAHTKARPSVFALLDLTTRKKYPIPAHPVEKSWGKADAYHRRQAAAAAMATAVASTSPSSRRNARRRNGQSRSFTGRTTRSRTVAGERERGFRGRRRRQARG